MTRPGGTRPDGAQRVGHEPDGARPVILLAMTERLIGQFFPAALRTRLDALGEVVASPTPDDHLSAAARPMLARADVIVTGWDTALVDDAVLDAAPRLRVVVHTAASVKNIVSPACYARGVAISSQAAAMAEPVAQYTLAMILLAGKGAFRAQRTYRARRAAVDIQTEFAGYGIHHTRVGIIGASTIGRRVIELLRPVSVDVVLSDPTLDEPGAAALGVTLVGLDELMATCPVVSLHAPVLPRTIAMVTARHLRSMPDGATFINTARGILVDQDALLRELGTGRVDAILDVTWPEVGEPDSPLWDLPNVVLTPHIAGSMGVELAALALSAIDEIERAVTGRPLRHPVLQARYDGLA